MKKFTIYIFVCLVLTMLLITGCSDINNATSPEQSAGIKSVVPAMAPYGARVVIGGKGFGEVQQVLFNGANAQIEAASDTTILTRVPRNATSGPIKVVSSQETYTGPSFTVDSTKNLFLRVDRVSPTEVRVRDTVKISGVGFNSTKVEVEESLSKSHSNSSGDEKVNSDARLLPGGGKKLLQDGDEKMNQANDMPAVRKKFKTVAAQPEVFFNEIPAPIINVSDTLIIATVPESAESGLVSVIVEADTAIGPEITVLRHTISGLSPTSGIIGTEVTISGNDFSEQPSDNMVAFGGTEAPVLNASRTELITEVPEGAKDGPVEVQIGDQSVTGPDFDVITTGDLLVRVITTGANLDSNGYLISVDGGVGERVAINDTLSQTGLAEGTYEVGISDIESNCSTTGDFPNPRTVAISAGETTTIEYNITCEGTNDPPVAQFTAVCTNLTCDFDASGSSDSDGTVESYEWVFDDGTTGSGQTVSHTYELPGFYTVQLTVIDNEAATAIETKDITVTVPQITDLSPSSGPVGTEVTIVGNRFSNTISENSVSFTSGNAFVSAPIKSASETELVVDVPGDATTGPVQVTVNGYTVEGPTFTVEVLGNLEVITSTTGSSFDPNGYLVNLQGVDEQTVEVNDTLFYNDLEVGSYEVGISDIASNCQLSEELPNPRTVDLAQNTTTSATFNIFCSDPNEPPVAEFTWECTNLTCNFDGSGSTDADGTISSYAWEFGDGTNAAGQTANHSYEVPGTYTVQLTVTDDDGATDILSQDVAVTIPEITGISPESGSTGTEVIITGDNFSSTASENVVEFNGVRAELNSASETELLAIVPGSATTGPVTVTIDGYMASGPTFTVQEPKTLEVSVETEGTEIDSDGYTLLVTDESDRIVKPNDNVMYSEIYANSVDVELTGVADNCRVDGDNPRTVNLNNSDNAGFTSFTIDCTMDIRGYIVYELTENGDVNSDIYLRNEDRTINRSITNTINVSEQEPAISPDGLSITYSDGRYIYIMDSDGSDVQQIVEDGYNSSPSWSPTGEQIVFERFVTSEIPDLYIMNRDGSNLQNITNTETIAERDPDWSSDGELIVYSRNADSSMSIFTIQPNGAGQTQLTANTANDTEPEWSPSGDRIAFTRFVQDVGSKVYLMNSDGSAPEELTPSSMNEGSPSWSPDGTKMAYSVMSDGVYQIYVFSVEVSDVVHTYYTSSDDESPHWNH